MSCGKARADKKVSEKTAGAGRQHNGLLGKADAGLTHMAELMRLSQEIIAARPHFKPLLEKAWDNLKFAEAQCKAL